MSSFKRNFIISVISGLIALAIVILGVYFHDYYREREERVTASAAGPPLTICSCTSKSPVPHRTEPTCTTSGRSYTTCGNCGGRIGDIQTLAALGHNYEWVVDKAATCTEEGSRHQECTRCNATGTTETIAMLAHTSDMFKHVDEPTCTGKGYIYNLCTVCGARINEQMQNALGHSYSWVVDKAATCTEEGSRHEECSRCHLTGATETIAMVEHTSDEFKHVDEPTCTAKGYIYNLCTVCGARINEQMQNALGHSYSWVVDKAATCTEEGSRHEECSRCHVTGATETIAVLAHTSDEFKHVDEPTCTEKGYIYNLCTVCGARINVQMQNALGHSYSWVRTTSPTCTAEGVDSYQCSRCRDVTETRSVAALGHDYEWIVDREATCANSGSRHQECTRCHATGATESVDKVAHTPTNIQLVQPTCTAPGWKVYFCMECGQECSRKENGAALGHDYEWVYDKEASCSVDGLRHQKCSRCSSETAQETYRDAHTPGLKDLVAPTCTTPGYTIYRCSVCNVEMSRDTVPALGHSCNVPDATCTVSMECTRCGLTIKPALGHDTHPCVDETCGKCGEMVAATMNHAWSDWQLVSEATATHEGEKVRTCEVCGAEERQAIPVTGGSGENTGGSGTDDGSGGDGDFNIGDSISGIEIPDGAKVAIAAVGGVLLVSVVIGVFTSVFGKKRKR